MSRRTLSLLMVIALTSGCAGSRVTAREAAAGPESRIALEEEGFASYYGFEHHGRQTASGERFDADRLTAAHRTLPFGTRVRVTNLGNGKQVTVTVTDRGPFRRHRVIDVSRRAARDLGLLRAGTARVRLEVLTG